MDLNFLLIDENSKWLHDVQKLGDDFRLTLGFMPAQAFVDYAKHKQILALIIDNEISCLYNVPLQKDYTNYCTFLCFS